MVDSLSLSLSEKTLFFDCDDSDNDNNDDIDDIDAVNRVWVSFTFAWLARHCGSKFNFMWRFESLSRSILNRYR